MTRPAFNHATPSLSLSAAILILSTLTLLASCNKSSPPATTPSSALVSQAVYAFPSTQGRTVINLGYNSAQQIAYLSFYSYDTSGGISNVDTGAYHFTIDPVTNLPTAYAVVGWKSALASSEAETHSLSFDANGRMTKDTLLTGQTNAGDSFANYYSYSTNRIIIRDYSLYAYDTVTTGTGWGANVIDTMTLVNGNLATQAAYYQNGGSGWILTTSTDINNYSNFANPLYNAKVSNSLGAFFLNQNLVDFLSKQLPSDGVAHWTTDAGGKVISGLAIDGTTVTFTYQ
jgi:hypothetical protein